MPGVRGAYMRAEFNGRRRELLTEWAELLLDAGFASRNAAERSAAVTLAR